MSGGTLPSHGIDTAAGARFSSAWCRGQLELDLSEVKGFRASG